LEEKFGTKIGGILFQKKINNRKLVLEAKNFNLLKYIFCKIVAHLSGLTYYFFFLLKIGDVFFSLV